MARRATASRSGSRSAGVLPAARSARIYPATNSWGRRYRRRRPSARAGSTAAGSEGEPDVGLRAAVPVQRQPLDSGWHARGHSARHLRLTAPAGAGHRLRGRPAPTATRCAAEEGTGRPAAMARPGPRGAGDLARPRPEEAAHRPHRRACGAEAPIDDALAREAPSRRPEPTTEGGPGGVAGPTPDPNPPAGR